MGRRRVALVTGGAQGIGLAIAETLCRDGMAVGLMDVNRGKLRWAVRGLTGMGFEVVGAPGDVTRPGDVDRVVRQVSEDLGPIDVLVNNAGVFITEPNRAEDTELHAWRRVIDVNVNGTFLMAQRVGRLMIERRSGGTVVNVASVFGLRAMDWRLFGVGPSPPRYDDAPYSVSKAAVIQLTRVLAVSWAPFRIRVNSVSPGPIDTESNREVLSPTVFRKVSRRVPAGRWGDPIEVAEAVAFLVSERAAYITGANLVVDGGWVCW